MKWQFSPPALYMATLKRGSTIDILTLNAEYAITVHAPEDGFSGFRLHIARNGTLFHFV